MTATAPANLSEINLRRSYRTRWAIPLAATIAVAHLFSGLILAGWFYWIVPRFKYQLDSYGVQISAPVLSIIQFSDILVNYWYVLIPIVPVALILDFLVAWWTAREIGRRFAIAYGLAIMLLFFANGAISQYLLNETKARALGL